MSPARTPNDEATPQEGPSLAERLRIPEHALAALEYQARRHYRRWWLDEAERIARLVIRFDVGRPAAWFVLGDIEMRRMNWGEAFLRFQQVVDCGGADAMAWCRGAEALLRGGEYGRAERWLRQATTVGPPGGSPGAHRARALLERHAQLFARARQEDLPNEQFDRAEPQPSWDEAPTQKMPALDEAPVRVPHVHLPVRSMGDSSPE